MGNFILGKVPLGKEAFSSEYKLGLGKVDPRLLSLKVNSQSGSGIRLYDADYGGKFGGVSDGLSGWPQRRFLGNTVAAVGAPTDGMQLIGLEVFYGSGADAKGKVYLGGQCRWDFNDLRVSTADGEAFTMRRRDIVEGVSCKVDVFVPLNMNTSHALYLYFGNEVAEAVDDDSTFEAVIDDVAGAWPLDEAEVGDAIDYSGNGNDGVSTGTTVVDSPHFTGKYARQFPSTNRLNLGNSASLDFGSAVTIALKVKMPSSLSTSCMFYNTNYNNNSCFTLYFGTGGQLYYWAKNSSGTEYNGNAGNLNMNTAYSIMLVWDGTSSFKAYITGKTDYTAATPPPYSPDQTNSSANTEIGSLSFPMQGLIVEQLTQINAAVSKTDADIWNANYPNVSLEEGKVLVHRYATTTQPDWGTPNGATETRRAYAATKLYASQDNLNFQQTQAEKKLSIEAYVGNTDEESAAATVLTTGATANFWTLTNTGTGSIEGTLTQESDRVKIAISTGSFIESTLTHNFAPVQNWSNAEFICVEIWGSNSGRTHQLFLFSSATFADSKRWDVTDNWIGKKWVVLPLNNPTQTAGSFNLATITQLRFDAGNGLGAGTWYVGRVVVDVGSWAFRVFGVPDLLALSGAKWKVTSWDTATEDWMAEPFLTDTDYDASKLKFLDGQTALQVYGADKGGASYPELERGENSDVTVGDASAGNLTLQSSDYYDTKNHVAVATKHAPADGAASATTGGSQAKIKIEIYYV